MFDNKANAKHLVNKLRTPEGSEQIKPTKFRSVSNLVPFGWGRNVREV